MNGGRTVTAFAFAPNTRTGYQPTAAAGVDRAIRVSTAIAVPAVADVAAYVSYWHVYAVVCAHGESGVTARLEPATIDGLVYASSMVNLYAARHRLPVPALARWLLALDIVATLAANSARAALAIAHGRLGSTYPQAVLLSFGFASIVIGALFMVRRGNFKQLRGHARPQGGGRNRRALGRRVPEDPSCTAGSARSSRSTSGFPAACRTRWPCYTASAWRWEGSPGRHLA